VVERLDDAIGEHEIVILPEVTEPQPLFILAGPVGPPAWALLLSRYSGEDGIVFGATRACRKPAARQGGA